jgi:hypothetical protein
MSIIPLVVIAFFPINYLERRFSKRWEKWYYLYGIPVFIINGVYRNNGLPQNSEAHKYDKNIELKKVGSDIHGFRIGTFKKYGVRMQEYSALRGYIATNETSRSFKIIFYVNWQILLLLGIFIDCILFYPRGIYLSILVGLIIADLAHSVWKMKTLLKHMLE